MIARYLPRIFRKKGLPIHLIYHCTYRCDANCAGCFLRSQVKAGGNDRELEPAELRKIRRFVGRLLWLQIGGGEPFLREDLAEVCAAFGDTHTVAIPTNGLVPKRIERRLVSILGSVSSKLYVVLSLDGLREDHDRIRGVPGNFEALSETYARVERLRRRYPRLKVGANTVLMKENQDKIGDIARWARSNWFLDMHAFEWFRGPAVSGGLCLPEPSRREELISIVKDSIGFYQYGGGLTGRFLQKAKRLEQDLLADVLGGGTKPVECYAGRLSAVLDPYGGVSGCETADTKIGHLRDCGYDFGALWSSARADAVRREAGKCRCTHSCVNLINCLFNPRTLYQIGRQD